MPRRRHIEGLEAARLANEKREPVSLLPSPSEEGQLDKAGSPSANEVGKTAPPRLGKLGRRGDVILAPQAELQAHKAAFREVFGETLSDEFVDEMLTRLETALAPGPWDVLEAGTLNAAIALIASVKPQTELEALLAVQIAATGFASLKFLQLGQRHLEDAYIEVYGGLWHSTAALAARADPSTGQAPAGQARQQADRRGPTCAYLSRCPGGGRHHQFRERRQRSGRK